MSGIQSISVAASQSYASIATQAQQSLQPFSDLNLTEAQRTQLRSIFTAAKQNGTSQADVQKEVAAVLTPAQQQTLNNDIKAGGGQFEHRRHENGERASQTSALPDDTSNSTASTTTDSSTLATITNIQNQVVAAQSTLVENLQYQILATNDGSTTQ